MSNSVESVKEQPLSLTRREFTLDAAIALLAGCVITVSDACGSSSTSPTPVAPTDINGAISANHNHVAIVTGAAITAGNAVTLTIQGTAQHNHTLSLSQADLTTLKNRQAVSRESSTDPSGTFGLHSHTVTFTPA